MTQLDEVLAALRKVAKNSRAADILRSMVLRIQVRGSLTDDQMNAVRNCAWSSDTFAQHWAKAHNATVIRRTNDARCARIREARNREIAF